jgi:hypothetical protein
MAGEKEAQLTAHNGEGGGVSIKEENRGIGEGRENRIVGNENKIGGS